MALLQWNADGYYAHTAELNVLINRIHPSVIALQETKFKPSHKPSIKNNVLFKEDYTEGLSACGGGALFTKNSLSPRLIPVQSNHQVVAIQLTISNMNISICNMY